MTVTREEIKSEVDKIPDHLLVEAYTLLKSLINEGKVVSIDWNSWEQNLKNFSDDFMVNRNQPFNT